MTTAELAALAGVFAGGAVPWLEAVVVIPAGAIGGLHPVPAFLAGVTGNLLTVALAAWAGDRLAAWWRARRAARRGRADVPATDVPATDVPATDVPATGARGGGRSADRAGRGQRVMARWGLPGLAVLGPLVIGTQAAVLVAVGFGVSARVAFGWIAAATVAWGAVAAALAGAGVSLAGGG